MKVSRTAKRQFPPAADVSALIEEIVAAPDNPTLLSVLSAFTTWRYSRGDLHAWVRVLDKFDELLAGVVDMYGLDKGPQRRDFLPKDRELIAQILRVQCLLLENCTNRKLFASYDRLFDLILANDLGILASSLFVLLRLLHQYGAQTPVPSIISGRLSQRLLTLTRGWERLHLSGWTLSALAGSTEPITLGGDAATVQVQYYPQASSSDATDGMSTLDLGNVLETMPEAYSDKIAQLAEEHHVPLEDQLAAINAVRLVLYARDPATRSQLIHVRLLALACYVALSSQSMVSSTIFLYDPLLLGQLAELLSPTAQVPPRIQSAALYALYSCARHRAKVPEVLAAVNANVNHGLLMSLMRGAAARLTSPDGYASDKDTEYELFDAIMSFVAYTTSVGQHVNVMIGAGLVPVLLEMLGVGGELRPLIVPRLSGLLDSLVFSFPQAMSAFTNADGINILVNHVKTEVLSVLESPSPEESKTLSKDTLIVYRTMALRSMLRSIHRMLHGSGGSDGMRNIVDTDLPKSIMRIFNEPEKFGSRVFGVAIHNMSTIVHNEPTSLSILQELQLPQALYAQLEKQTPTSFDVVILIPGAVGAICLNQTGLQETLDHFDVISKIISTVTTEIVEAEGSERDNVTSFGLTLDELVRHHPPLRPKVLESVFGVLRETVEEGKMFKPADVQARHYAIDGNPEAMQIDADKPAEEGPTNPVLVKLNKVLKLLSGVLRNTTTCREFIEQGGFDVLLGLPDLPCIPIRFHVTDAANALSGALRALCEHDSTQTLEKVIEAVAGALTSTSDIWEADDWRENWDAMTKATPAGTDIERFRNMRGLSIRLSILADILMNTPLASRGVVTQIIKALRVDSSTLVLNLGKLHRACFIQHVLLSPKDASASGMAPTEPVTPASVLELEEVEPANQPPSDKDRPHKALVRLLSTRMHAVLIRVFKSMTKLLFLRRNAELSYRPETLALAKVISQVVIGHLKISKQLPEHERLAVDIVAIGVASMLLFDDRGHDGYLHTTLFIEFDTQQGTTALIDVINGVLDRVESVKWAEGEEKPDETQVQALSALKVSLSVLSALVLPRALLEGPQTAAVVQRELSRPPAKRFSPVALFLTLRLAILPVAHRVWTSPWLVKAPLPTVRAAVNTFLTIMDGKNEDPEEAEPAYVAPVIPAPSMHTLLQRRTLAADPERVAQLVDMGFGRAAASSALIRARNNVAQAADLILSMPHLFPAGDPAEPDAPVDAPAAAEGEAEADAAPDAEAADAIAVDADTEAVPAEDEPPVTGSTSSASYQIVRNLLDNRRKGYRAQIAERSLELAEHVHDIVFDIMRALPKDVDGFKFIIDQLESLSHADAPSDNALAARLRLLPVLYRKSGAFDVDADTVLRGVRALLELSVDTAKRPAWTASLLLSADALYTLGSRVAPAGKIGDEPVPVVLTIDNGDATARFAEIARNVLRTDDASAEERLAALRLLAVLARQDPSVCDIDTLTLVLSICKKADPKLRGCFALLALFIRYGIEGGPDGTRQVLAQVLQREIADYAGGHSGKVMDVKAFVRMQAGWVSRDPAAFVDAMEKECALLDPDPLAGVYHLRAKATKDDKDKMDKDKMDKDKEGKPADVFSGPFEAFERHPVMDHLVGELAATSRNIKTATDDAATDAHAYMAFLLALITELVGSYRVAKSAFMAAIRSDIFQASPVATGAANPSRSGLLTILSELVCAADLPNEQAPQADEASARRLAVSGWASSLIVALCANEGVAEQKDAPEDLTAVRKAVVDAIAKAIKDASGQGTQSDAGASARYSRLSALGELVHRLLTSRPSRAGNSDDSTLHIAKIMLEKNLVGLFTTAIGEIDVNFPNIKAVLEGLLKALDLLSKISIKWGKTGDKSKASDEHGDNEGDDDDASTEFSSEDEHMSEDEDAAADMYRNSALGILGGEIVNEDDIDEEGEDEEMMEAYGDEYDQEMEDDELDTDPSDEGEDDQNMEDDWTDEDEGNDDDMDGVEDEGDEDVIGLDDADVLLEDDEGPWAAEGDMAEDGFEVEYDDEDDEDSDIHNDDEGVGYGSIEDEFDAEDEMALLDEAEEYDDIDVIDGSPLRVDNDAAAASGPWGWSAGSSSANRERAHRSRLFGGDPDAAMLLGLPPRPTAPVDDIEHPLLVRPDQRDGTRAAAAPTPAATLADLLASVDGHGAQQALEYIESIMHQGHSGVDGIRVNIAHRSDGGVNLAIGGRQFALNRNTPQDGPDHPADITTDYRPQPTASRWTAAAPLVAPFWADSSDVLMTHVVNRLLPPARKAAEAEAELEAKDREQRDEEEQEEAERARVAAEEVERAMQADVETAAAVRLPESRQEEQDVVMEPADEPSDEPSAGPSAPEVEEPEAGPSESLARVYIRIHGEDVDITDSGMDIDFLEALPEDMRADVVEQHLREQNENRQPAASLPIAAQHIDADFLEALPASIRRELMQTEAAGRGRRHGQPAGESETLDGLAGAVNTLRNEALSLLDEVLEPMLAGAGGPLGVARRHAPLGRREPEHPHRRDRDAIQLLEKPGIASLVRLLFFPEALRKNYLFKILVNLCENSRTRADLLNLLLSVVQDGSGDLVAVDRSFQQMSLKALSTPKATPSRLKLADTPGTATSAPIFAHLQTDHIPTFIAQRCFEALAYIVSSNAHAVTYFLTEHEHVGLRNKSTTKKGKGKEKSVVQTKYPIVILLGLLDRPELLKVPGMMDSLTSLLSAITKPLANLPVTPVDDKPAEAQVAKAQGDAPTQPNPLATPAQPAPAAEAETARPKSPTLRPPVIPQSYLRLVVNCLTVGECSSRTFGQTLSVLQNLSYIPEAKQVLVNELCQRARQLGGTIQTELRQLRQSLVDAGQAIDTHTLAAFSPPWSSQAQLLRLLKTIDYLHSRKSDSDANDQELAGEEIARGIFSSFDFAPMWTQLGDCLTAAEGRDSTEQIASVLLPLVEALMVVCKYSRPADAPAVAASPVAAASTPPPADLFVTFTSTHRKVLNAIVRNNPSLMSGSFSLLVTNPRVLDFDNKRNWFFQKLKRKRDQVPAGPLHLNIRRQYVFEDSFHALRRRSGDEIKYGKINVKFINEDGVDAGGVTREWYSVLAQQIFDPNFALFEPCAADKQTYQPNKFSSVNDDHLSLFKFVGRVIGKAVYDSRLLDAYFSRAFYKQILGKTVDTRDLESIDPAFHKSLQWMLDNDITGVIDQEFTIEDDLFGEKKIVELKEGGAKIPVTEDNKAEYVRLVVSYRLDNSIKAQIKAFLDGFYEIIPRHLVQIFEPDQLELLISGITTIDVDELKNATQLTGWKSTDPEISWFWRALRSFSQEERSRFLMFVTSSSRVPLGGYTQLQGSSGTQPFQIQKLYGKEGSLPQASTCFNLLLLPQYESYEQLRERLMFAVTETGGFGKA
ncbi:E3 ubiquitin-protein ligase tom1 [Cryptotrichosporon argae]